MCKIQTNTNLKYKSGFSWSQYRCIHVQQWLTSMLHSGALQKKSVRIINIIWGCCISKNQGSSQKVDAFLSQAMEHLRDGITVHTLLFKRLGSLTNVLFLTEEKHVVFLNEDTFKLIRNSLDIVNIVHDYSSWRSYSTGTVRKLSGWPQSFER